MAREIPIARAFRKMLQTRFRNTIYGDIRSVLETIVPVQVVGTDYSDQERPSWCVAGFQAVVGGEFASASLSSAVDIAVENFSWHTRDLVGFSYADVLIHTPPAAYVPFLNNGVIWTAGVRPTISFDTGRTWLITGTNPAAPPFWGYRLNPSRVQWGGGGRRKRGPRRWMV